LILTEGRIVLLVLAVVIGIVLLFYKPVAWFGVALLIGCIWFFRNPDRICPAVSGDDSVLVCPSDGKVVDVQQSSDNEFEGYAQKVSIFLSVFDVHVNWLPMSGIIKAVNYKSGAFKLAFLPKSSDLNERNDIIVEDEKGRTILVRQIAGLIARRICCWVKKDENVNVCQKYGMIRFGSRVDILLPENVTIEVKKGNSVYGGQTILGRWK